MVLAVVVVVVIVVMVVVVVVVAEVVVVTEVIVVLAAQTICHMKGMVLIDVCRKNYSNLPSLFFNKPKLYVVACSFFQPNMINSSQGGKK